MTRLAFQDGKLILRDGKAAIGEDCCCGAGCENCPLACCITIQGRDAFCGSGTAVISNDPLIVENWGPSFGLAQWLYISDARDIEVTVEVSPCEDGVIALDVIIRETVPGIGGGGSTVTSTRRWQNATAILGEDGCPTGVVLGDLTENSGPDPALTLTLGWICT
jgi:hypothetical protein